MREAETDASPQAQDIAIQHTAPPLPVEGRNSHPRHVRAVQGEATCPHGVPDLRHVREATGPRRLTVDDVSKALSRVLGTTADALRSDTPVAGLGLDPDGWVGLAWALSETGTLRDADVPSLRTVEDIRQAMGTRA